MKTLLLSVLILLVCHTNTFAQVNTQTDALQLLSKQWKIAMTQNQQQAYKIAKAKHWDLVKNTPHGVAKLVGITPFNTPIYYSTFDNLIAAASVSTNQLWHGGSLGLNLSGASASVTNKMAIWDGAGVRGTHKEMVGRVTQVDGASVFGGGSQHATHVAGTMMATGINPLVKGMSFGYKSLQAYDFDFDNTEMSAAAANLLISNHSYGTICGWVQGFDGSWTYMGRNGDSTDYNFGYYSQTAADWDKIAFNAPYYLIVKASGNNRDQNGPAVGKPYYYFDIDGNKITDNRPAGISNNSSYGTIGTTGNAKNILTIGAVNGIPNGYNRKEDVVMTSFSSWGPTDDGRIKPDLVGDGVNVLSTTSTSDSDYLVESGTSMASPNVAGSLLLLQEYYNSLSNGLFMRAATLKGLAIHTADEAGAYPGPDYRFGWGLLNTQKAAIVVKDAVSSNNGVNSKHLLYENILNNNQTFTTQVVVTGNSPLIATISWTDPVGNVDNVNVLNNPAPKLVNDLDIRISKDGITYFPWVLSPTVPDAPATHGDNKLDNVEKIQIDNVIPGQTYSIQITHKGTLTGGSQAYSLLISGVGGNAYCIPTIQTANGISIDSVSVEAIHYKKNNSCNSYRDNTNLTASIKPSQSLPIYIQMGNCGSNNQPKAVQVYIDYNGNGSFADAGEQVANTKLAATTNIFSTTVNVPASLVIGTATLMRIVVADTTAINAGVCATFSNGETDDFKVQIVQPDNDFTVASIISPTNGDYPKGKQYLTVKLTNVGNYNQSNIKLAAVISSGSATIANLTGNYPSPILSGASAYYTFETPFFTAPNTNYSISTTVTAPVDENSNNNTLVQSVDIASTVSATANNCNGSTNLKVISSVNATNYSWFNTINATNAIAKGTVTATPYQDKENTLYLSAGTRANVGLSNKGTTSGGYLANANSFINYTATQPVTLETVRIYAHNPGTVTIMAADIINATSAGYNYQVLNSKEIMVFCSHPTPVAGSVAGNSADDKGAVYEVQLNLPAGSHSIIVSTTDASLFRNTSLPSAGYPFTIPGVFSLTGNSAYSPTNTGDTTFYRNFYYFLYDMTIATQDCVGDRIPIAVITSPRPVISYANDSLVSSIPKGNQWYADNQAIAGATSQSFYPTNTAAMYQLITTDSFGCSRKSLPFYLDKVVPLVSPNPSYGKSVVSFYVKTPTNIDLSLVNIAGKVVYKQSFNAFQGNFNQAIHTNDLAAGLYVLQIIHNGEKNRIKVLVRH